jgi:hypothetical protein
MAYENPMEGPAVPPQTTGDINRGVTHAHKTVENLRSTADVTADEYRHLVQGAWEDAVHRVRSFQDDSKNMSARTQRRQS